MQISPQATGVSLTVCVLQHYPRHTDKETREYPPLDSLSRSLYVDLELRNLNSKLPCQSLPTLPYPTPSSGPTRDYSAESLVGKLLGASLGLTHQRG